MLLTEQQQLEVAEVSAQQFVTKRPTSPALEAILGQVFPVLDHGFVRVVDYMGDDASVVQAARVSYGRGTKKVSEDKGLISYLMRQRHSTPFEMAELKLHIRAPIFVIRQWIRHRTASVNEASARYSIMDKEFYLPAIEHMGAQSSINRQGRGDTLSGEEAEAVLRLLREDADRNYSHYEWMLNEGEADPERQGFARELARMNLTLNTYTQLYWKSDLWNLLNFLSLRVDSHAQYEIRAYAEVMLGFVRDWLPLTFAAFQEHRLDAFLLSGTMVEAVNKAVAGQKLTQESSGLSKRMWDELSSRFPGIK